MRYAAALAVLCALAVPAGAQEYLPKGLGHPSGTSHWYEGGCCNRQDCEAVEPGAIRRTAEGYRVRYMTSRGFIAEGLIPYGSPKIRPSRDQYEHACASPTGVLCIYLPMMT